MCVSCLCISGIAAWDPGKGPGVLTHLGTKLPLSGHFGWPVRVSRQCQLLVFSPTDTFNRRALHDEPSALIQQSRVKRVQPFRCFRASATQKVLQTLLLGLPSHQMRPGWQPGQMRPGCDIGLVTVRPALIQQSRVQQIKRLAKCRSKV